MQQLYIFPVGNLNVKLKEVDRVGSGRVGSELFVGNRGSGRVGSTFCRVGSGRVGSKKSDPWTTLFQANRVQNKS